MQNTAKETSGGFWTAVLAIINLIANFFKRKDQNNKSEEIAMAKQELSKALAEGRIGDAAYWRKKLTQLTSLLLILLLPLLTGCTTPQQPVAPVEPQYVIIGERVNLVKAGDVIKVPPLMPPAKQWYLVDDRGLFQWLDVNLGSGKAAQK